MGVVPVYFIDRITGQGVELYRLIDRRFLLAASEPRFVSEDDTAARYIPREDRRLSSRREGKRPESGRRRRDFLTPGRDYEHARSADLLHRTAATLQRVRRSGAYQM
jgi:hypothetical protein